MFFSCRKSRRGGYLDILCPCASLDKSLRSRVSFRLICSLTVTSGASAVDLVPPDRRGRLRLPQGEMHGQHGEPVAKVWGAWTVLTGHLALSGGRSLPLFSHAGPGRLRGPRGHGEAAGELRSQPGALGCALRRARARNTEISAPSRFSTRKNIIKKTKLYTGFLI